MKQVDPDFKDYIICSLILSVVYLLIGPGVFYILALLVEKFGPCCTEPPILSLETLLWIFSIIAVIAGFNGCRPEEPGMGL